MREDSFDEYFDKKEEEYRTQAERYSGLFDGRSREYFRRNRLITVPRVRVIGDQIVTEWEHGPDRPGFMKEVVNTIGLGAKKIESIRKIPSELRMEGMAVTWAAIEAEMLRLRLPPNSKALRHVVQHLYFSQYLDELGLCTVTGLPFAKYDFGLARGGFGHDYEVLKHSLTVMGCWEAIILSPQRIPRFHHR